MQLTGPIFLFLFLPLSFFAVLPFSGRRRAVALLAVSLLWYGIANRQNPVGLGVVGGLSLVCWLLTLPRGARRTRLVFGTVLPLAVLLFCRITAEYGLFPRLPYPAGLTFVTFGLVSAAVDLFRRPESDARDPLAFFGYVLFFPVLTFGPVIPYRRFRAMLAAERPSFAAFARGARLFAMGYLLRVAGAAMLVRAISRVLAMEGDALHLPTVGVLLILSGGALWLLLYGVSDMARGVASFYGLLLWQDVRLLPRNAGRDTGGLLLSLSAFMRETVVLPLSRWRSVLARPLALTLGFIGSVLFFRCRWEMLLLSLPLFLLVSLPRAVCRRTSKPLSLILRVLSVPAFMLFSAGVLLPEPALLFRLFTVKAADSYYYFQLFAALSDLRYLLLLVVMMLALLWRRYRSLTLLRLTPGNRARVVFTESLLVLTAFVAAVVFIMPQFPILADQPFLWLHL